MVTADKREAARLLCDSGLSVSHFYKVAHLSRSSFYRQPRDWRVADAAVIDALNEQTQKSPQAGFWKCYERLRRQGYPFNHKHVYRVYCQMGLNKPRRKKRARPKRVPKPLAVLPIVNHQ